MTVTTIINEVQAEVAELTKQMEEAKQKLVDKLKPEFHGLFKDFFNKHPEVRKLSFAAYSPYFNDGEPCEYSVHELQGYLVDPDIEDEDDYEDCVYEGDLPMYGPSATELLAFKRTGEISDYLVRVCEYQTKPSYRFDYKTGTHIETPAKYATIEEAVSGQYADRLSKTQEELEKEGILTDDFKQVSAVLASIPDDIIYDLFGNHVQVVITRDGVEVLEHDHD